jgi:hypothetical protein
MSDGWGRGNVTAQATGGSNEQTHEAQGEERGRRQEAVDVMRQKVRTLLDVETDDGGKVVLTILRSGGLSVQTFRASMSAKSLYRLETTVTLEPGFIREWAETLFLVTRGDPRRGHEVNAA